MHETPGGLWHRWVPHGLRGRGARARARPTGRAAARGTARKQRASGGRAARPRSGAAGWARARAWTRCAAPSRDRRSRGAPDRGEPPGETAGNCGPGPRSGAARALGQREQHRHPVRGGACARRAAQSGEGRRRVLRRRRRGVRCARRATCHLLPRPRAGLASWDDRCCSLTSCRRGGCRRPPSACPIGQCSPPTRSGSPADGGCSTRSPARSRRSRRGSAARACSPAQSLRISPGWPPMRTPRSSRSDGRARLQASAFRRSPATQLLRRSRCPVLVCPSPDAVLASAATAQIPAALRAPAPRGL